MNETGIGEVRTKLLDTDHKQWNCGMGLFDPNKVFYKEDPNGYVIIDGKRCKLVEKPNTSDPTVAILNGEVLENSFYKNPNDDIICSKLVDSISLPAGYNKCYYVYNANPTSGTTVLITTNLKLVEKYGHAYCTAKVNVLNTSYGSIYSNGAGGANNVTRILLAQDNTRCILYSNMAGNQGGQHITSANHIFAYEMTEDGKYREILVDTNYKALDHYVQGNPNTDEVLKFLSDGSEVNLYYMFVIDDNKNVSSCFIPCQNATTGQYGLYEVVSNQFFGSDSLTGVLLPNVKFIYEKIGDKIYKTVKIGNLQWMCENLDYKWDGLEIGNIYAGQGAAYREDDEATWGWNGRKAGLYYNRGSIVAMAGDDSVDPPIPSILPDGWRLPTDAEYTALREYVKDENDVERVDKLFVPECSWSPYEHPADAKMNETGLSLIPAGYYINGGEDEGWSDLDNEHCSSIVISDGDGSYGNTYIVYAPTSSTYGLFENWVADFPASVRLVKDV